MDVSEFRTKIKPGIMISVDNREYLVREVVKFRLDDGSFYIKCFLNDSYVLADDLNEDCFILVKEVETEFKLPFPEKVNFNGKELEFLYAAHAIAEETWGEEIFKKGDSERFWDYKAEDNSYLSLGVDDATGNKLDFYGKVMPGSNIRFKTI